MENTGQGLAMLAFFLRQELGVLRSLESWFLELFRRWRKEDFSARVKSSLKNYENITRQHTRHLTALMEVPTTISLQQSRQRLTPFIRNVNTRLALLSDQQMLDRCLLACLKIISDYKADQYSRLEKMSVDFSMALENNYLKKITADERHYYSTFSQLADEIEKKTINHAGDISL